MTLYSWSQTAASNATADTTVNWREGQSPSTVNNSARAMMAAVAKYRDDEAGIITTGGSSTAYTATSNQGYTANGDGHTITVEIHATSGATPTLNVDSRGAQAILLATGLAPPSGTLVEGSIVRLTDNGTNWVVNGYLVTLDESFDDASFEIVDNSDATKVLKFQLSGITTATTRTITIPDASSTMLVASDIGTSVQAFDADTLKADTADNLTAGFTASAHAAGTQSGSGTYTPDPANGNFQTATNGGAHTLAPPSSNCTMIIQYTNNVSAGTITTSGFTLVDGDTITTTNGDDFFFQIVKIGSFSSLTVKALQ